MPAAADAAALPLVPDAFSYPATAYEVEPRPHGHPGFQVAPCPADAGPSCSVGGVVADGGGALLALRQLHFHKPSEHTVNGTGFAFEMHVVHVDAAGGVAEVLAVLFPAADAHNALLDSLWLEINSAKVVGRVALEQLLAATLPVEWAYDGSLSSPPCSAGVRWRVRVATAGVNVLQLIVFEYATGGLTNARPLQPAGGRAVAQSVWRRG